jgi:hypothetical protein
MNKTSFITNGNIWQHAHAALALCEDGKIRKVRLEEAADNAFAWPGKIRIANKTIRGYVGSNEDGLFFVQYKSAH